MERPTGVEPATSSLGMARSRGRTPLLAGRSKVLATGLQSSELADRVASDLRIRLAEKQTLLEMTDPVRRLEKLLEHLRSRAKGPTQPTRSPPVKISSAPSSSNSTSTKSTKSMTMPGEKCTSRNTAGPCYTNRNVTDFMEAKREYLTNGQAR